MTSVFFFRPMHCISSFIGLPMLDASAEIGQGEEWPSSLARDDFHSRF